MDGIKITTAILSLIAGVGVFLISCTMMSNNLEALGSRRLKALFSKTSKSKLAGVAVGTATTAVIQSSSATSVMVIGFVNAGIMSLTQAATVIFGANIGTTVTGQLVALGMFGSNTISSSVIFATLAGVGAFILAFARNDKTKTVGGILAGFGMLFVGLDVMGNSMKFFSELEGVKTFLAAFRNPLLLVLVGALFTALIQSSSVMTSMTITMVVTGLISLDQGIYVTMGANIGTCVTALMVGLTSTPNAKRTALIHLIFNVSGVIVFMLAGLLMSAFGTNYGSIFAAAFPNAPNLQMSMFHTVFNVITVIFVLPLTNTLVKLVTKIVPDRKAENAPEERLKFVEDHMLATPSVAVMEVKNEIMYMASVANENFNIACDMLCSMNDSEIEKFRKNENLLDYTNKALNRFIAELLGSDLTEKDRLYLSSSIKSVSDLERVGDYAENITEYYYKLSNTGEKFSPYATAEIDALKKIVNELFAETTKAYRDCDRDALSVALATEEKIDGATDEMTERHIERLEKGECSPEVGAQFLSLSSTVERIADHYVNVAKTIKTFA